MSASETLYWFNIATNLREVACAICALTPIVYVLLYAVPKKIAGDGNPSKKITTICVIVFSICLLLSILLPDDSTYFHYKYELGEQAVKEQIMKSNDSTNN